MAITWTRWEVPLTAAPGKYRFVITAKRYAVASRAFRVRAGALLTPQISGDAVQLTYPQPFLLNDWTFRPRAAAGGSITFLVDGRRHVERERVAAAFPIPRGAHVTIAAHEARDRYGNVNPRSVRIR